MKKEAGNGKEFVQRLADAMSRKGAIEAQLKGKISAAIIRSRYEKSMNQNEFAAYMGVSQAMVSKWENCDCNFSVSSIATICEKLNLIPEICIKNENAYIEASINDWPDISQKSKSIVEDSKLALAS